MKIFVKDKVYVQKKDLTHLLKAFNGKSIPSSIIDKVFNSPFFVNKDNEYDFVSFESLEAVDFFKKCTWIIDYNEFDGMTYEEMMDYAFHIFEEINKVINEYNGLPEEERKKEEENTSIAIELLEHKMWSVRDVLWHKQGHLKFPLPYGTRTNYFINEPKKQSVLRRLLNRFK